MSAPCFIYIIETLIKDEDDAFPPHVKVGVSSNPWARRAGLQTGWPRELGLFATFRFESRHTAFLVEQKAHSLLCRDRQEGEWFDADRTEALVAIFDAAMLLKIEGLPIDLNKIFSKGEVRFALGRDGEHARAWRNRK